MWIQRKDARDGNDIICDMCGGPAHSYVMVANILVAEVCKKGADKLRGLIQAQLKTMPNTQANSSGFILDPSGNPTEVNVVDIFRKDDSEEKAPETVKELAG